MRILTVIPVLAAAAALASGAAAATPVHCQARSIGPGSLQRGGTAGAACLLAAFDKGCRAADYTLSQFGVDTAHSETFRTQSTSGGCQVVVTESFRVVPQQPHVTGHRTCMRMRRTATDVVADRCAPKQTISLTKLSG